MIIFTHNLSFLYFLKNYAEKNQIDVITHWIKCKDTDKKPWYVFLNSSPALEREYRKAKKARELYEEAKKADAGWSTEQAEAILDLMRGITQIKAAEKYGISQSAFSQRFIDA